MLYLYDQAIVDDLVSSFQPSDGSDPVVKVIDPESVIGLAASIQEDSISFPIVALIRDPDSGIDTSLTNFTRIHKGVPTVFDNEHNEIYYEKVLPIKLSYAVTLLATNTADIDELTRELLFKYSDMYYLTIQIPYESKRRIRFGVVIDRSTTFDTKSSVSDYFQKGQLYQRIIPMRCEGCVLVTYTPQKLKRVETQFVPIAKNQQNLI